MTPLELVTTALVSGAAAYLGSYLRKKGENLATHEDIDKLVEQVSAVTVATKQIESKISNEAWRRERRAELQLKAIEAVNALTSKLVTDFIDNSQSKPSLEWFSAFSAASATVKALFDEETFAMFKKLEIRIGPGLGSEKGSTFAVWEFIEVRDAALKAMYSRVTG
jgi:hypothetical protein